MILIFAVLVLRMMSDFDVAMGDMDSAKDFFVKFYGPKDSMPFLCLLQASCEPRILVSKNRSV